jgi:hypothetical protein
MDWRETVTSVSDKVFPGLSQKVDKTVYGKKLLNRFVASENVTVSLQILIFLLKCILGNEVTSNLPLQMSLYFNVVFAPFWMTIILLYLKDTVRERLHF